MRFRSADTELGLANSEWSDVFGPFPPAEMPVNLLSHPNSIARFMEVEVKLYSAEGGATPVLTKLEVIGMIAQ